MDGIPDAVWPIERRPTGGVSTADVIRDVLLMHEIALCRRKQRFDSGAVSLHRTKLSVQRDAQGNPVGLGAYPIGHSNRLVEEYMLLANYLVAQHLIMHASSRALLRRHPGPLSTKVAPCVETLQRLGFTGFQWASSKSLQKSLTRAVKQSQRIAAHVHRPMQPQHSACRSTWAVAAARICCCHRRSHPRCWCWLWRAW